MAECGGKDRFRFLDTDGNGTWICNRCGAGAGAELVMQVFGLTFREAAQRIEAVMGHVQPDLKRASDDRAQASAFAKKMWARGVRVQRGDVADRWLRSRGVGMDLYPPCLRTSPLDWYRDQDGERTSRHPAMLALVFGADGRPVAVHRTYLSPDGQSKAPVPKPRKMAGKHGMGPTIRLTPVGPVLGIAEGLESALSASRLFGIPTWSVVSTYGIETFEPPVEVKRLFIFGDNDANGAGQRAAHALAARLAGRIHVEVKIPETPGTDWNDALRCR
jgi:putative DNA primase/helicase